MTAEMLDLGLVTRITMAVLLQFFWQGMLIAILVAVASAAVPERRWNVRYAISLIGLTAMLAAPAITAAYYCLCPDALPASALVATGETAGVAGLAGARGEAHSLTFFQQIFAWFDANRTLWIGTWLFGLSLLSVRLTASYFRCFRLQHSHGPLPKKLRRVSERLKSQMNISARVIVASSHHVSQAIAVGVIRPMVLIPASWIAQMPVGAIEAVIAHELAHIRRFDLWINTAQRLLETVFFFHPAVWWLSRRTRLEREICCDHTVIKFTGDRLQYVRILAQVAEQRLGSGGTTQFATAFIGAKKMNLLRRIRLLLEPNSAERHSMLKPASAITGLAMLGVLISLAWSFSAHASPTAAQEDKLHEHRLHEHGDDRQNLHSHHEKLLRGLHDHLRHLIHGHHGQDKTHAKDVHPQAHGHMHDPHAHDDHPNAHDDHPHEADHATAVHNHATAVLDLLSASENHDNAFAFQEGHDGSRVNRKALVAQLRALADELAEMEEMKTDVDHDQATHKALAQLLLKHLDSGADQSQDDDHSRRARTIEKEYDSQQHDYLLRKDRKLDPKRVISLRELERQLQKNPHNNKVRRSVENGVEYMLYTEKDLQHALPPDRSLDSKKKGDAGKMIRHLQEEIHRLRGELRELKRQRDGNHGKLPERTGHREDRLPNTTFGHSPDDGPQEQKEKPQASRFEKVEPGLDIIKDTLHSVEAESAVKTDSSAMKFGTVVDLVFGEAEKVPPDVRLPSDDRDN